LGLAVELWLSYGWDYDYDQAFHAWIIYDMVSFASLLIEQRHPLVLLL